MTAHEPGNQTRNGQGTGTPIRQSIKEILDGALAKGDVRRVYGEPVERNGRTIIPVAHIGSGFGFGAGSGGEPGKEGEGGGGGGKVNGKPIGYIEITNDGSHFKPVYDITKLGRMAILATAILVWLLARKR